MSRASCWDGSVTNNVGFTSEFSDTLTSLIKGNTRQSTRRSAYTAFDLLLNQYAQQANRLNHGPENRVIVVRLRAGSKWFSSHLQSGCGSPSLLSENYSIFSWEWSCQGAILNAHQHRGGGIHLLRLWTRVLMTTLPHRSSKHGA
jgi:hypothetical protein